MIRKCPQCGTLFNSTSSAANRAEKIGAPLYCGIKCAGLGRRKGKSKSQKIREKAEYDREYRAKYRERLKAEKAKWYQLTRDPEKERLRRKQFMWRHVEYCRQDSYREKKRAYDRKRNEAAYADFAEAWRLLQELENEIRSQATAYDIRVANGYYLRNAQKRRRELWQQKMQLNPTS